MTVSGLVLLPILCGVATLSSYLYLLYVESLRFRPREFVRSFALFESTLRPRLGLEAEDGLRRFAVARQMALILLALDLMLLAQPEQPPVFAVLEALVLASAAMAVFVHLLPSILFQRSKGRWAQRFILPARLVGWSVQPFILLISFVSSLAELSAEESPAAKASSSNDPIEALLKVGQEEGLIGQEDRKLIQSVVEFGDKTVREAMTPRPRIVAIDVGQSVDELRQLFIESEYSRIPIYDGNIDKILGFIHSRDILDLHAKAGKADLRELIRPLPTAPETKAIHQLLREMQEKNHQMCIVVDEYGHTAGLTTMEDLMEEIVGEIGDESEPVSDVVVHPDESIVVAGNLDLDRLEELVDFRANDEFESTTIGGLVCEQLGQVPAPGAKVVLDGIQIEVLAADERHVSSLRVRRLPEHKLKADKALDSDSPDQNSTNEQGVA